MYATQHNTSPFLPRCLALLSRRCSLFNTATNLLDFGEMNCFLTVCTFLLLLLLHPTTILSRVKKAVYLFIYVLPNSLSTSYSAIDLFSHPLSLYRGCHIPRTQVEGGAQWSGSTGQLTGAARHLDLRGGRQPPSAVQVSARLKVEDISTLSMPTCSFEQVVITSSSNNKSSTYSSPSPLHPPLFNLPSIQFHISAPCPLFVSDVSPL